MILKSYLTEKNLNILKDYKSVLIYGENQGLRDDLKNLIKNQNKQAEILNFFQEDLIKNKSQIINEAANQSLFNDQKIIFTHEVNDKIFELINEFIETGSNVKMCIFSNILERRSKLRNLFEKSKELAIIPCYDDNEITLINHVKNKLGGLSGITPEIINLIIKNSNYERNKINNEIDKFKTYSTKKIIDKQSAEDLLNIRSMDSFKKIKDASLIGNKKELNELISTVSFSDDNAFYYMAQIYQRIDKLKEINSIYLITKNIDSAVENLKPKVFWKDKKIFIDQSKKWNEKNLKIASSLISKTELSMKKYSDINKEILLKNLIINLCNIASVNA